MYKLDCLFSKVILFNIKNTVQTSIMDISIIVTGFEKTRLPRTITNI